MSGVNMNIKLTKTCLIVIFSSLFLCAAKAQEITIIGDVRDVNTHHEIGSVNIYIKGTQVGVTSDYTGRYTLRIPIGAKKAVVVFQHIGYDSKELTVESLMEQGDVFLQPRVIPLQGVTKEETRIRMMEIEKDIPQTVSMMEAKRFEIRGYVDAGDLLRTDHSVQVEEELSGKKTISMRGGNPDEIVVLFNGIRMNRSLDNVFDFSLINLEDVERVEIVKGSNTALYGPEAFSGVINIVPRRQYDYNIRFHQRFGTYRSGNWGLHLYKKLGPVHGSYSFKRGGMQRPFADQPDEPGLENTSLHHTANLTYSLSENLDGSPASSLSGTYMYSSLQYDNSRDLESVLNVNDVLSLQFEGDVGKVRALDLAVSLHRLNEEQYLVSRTGAIHRDIDDRSIQVNAEKGCKVGRVNLLFGYQLEQALLNFADERRYVWGSDVGLESAQFERWHHGFVSIAKIRGKVDSQFLQSIELDGSIRYDWLKDRQSDATIRNSADDEESIGIFGENEWNETMFKFAINLSGYRHDLTVDGYISFGYNTKFPTLFQQISSPSMFEEGATTTILSPEKNRNVELSVSVAKDLRDLKNIYGWKISGNFFQNIYDDKFRTSMVPGIPVMFYDNVPDARISGFEGKTSVFLFRKKMTVELGISKYFISEKAAFPFKSDYKHTANFIVEHAGYSLQIHLFKEGEQVGWIRDTSGGFAEISLPVYTNMDFHLSKTFSIGKLKFFANASGRNLLKDEDVMLLGLAIRDRRYYVTVGTQY
jgi:outer membrane receptor protein involved in Fe transport